jgi:voltage-gated potassium channel
MHLSKKSLRKQVGFIFGLFGFSLIVTTSMIWFFEPPHGHMQTYDDIIWWWVVTSSTVGYGDLVPVSGIGRLAGVLAIIIGIFGYTHTISLILQYVESKFEESERGRGAVNYQNHVVICEYTAFADELIQEIKANGWCRDHKLVIVGSLVERSPYAEFDFIYGVPISPQVQDRAAIPKASTIFVFSNTRFSEPDDKTLHTVSRIMQRNLHAHIIVELNNPEHPLLAELPREVTVMETDKLLKHAMNHEYLNASDFCRPEDIA